MCTALILRRGAAPARSPLLVLIALLHGTSGLSIALRRAPRAPPHARMAGSAADPALEFEVTVTRPLGVLL